MALLLTSVLAASCGQKDTVLEGSVSVVVPIDWGTYNPKVALTLSSPTVELHVAGGEQVLGLEIAEGAELVGIPQAVGGPFHRLASSQTVGSVVEYTNGVPRTTGFRVGGAEYVYRFTGAVEQSTFRAKRIEFLR